MIEDHIDIVWEYCPSPTLNLHGCYRGFDLHQWGGVFISFICFYPSEGEATVKEMVELYERIPSPRKYGMRNPEITNHPSEGCGLKERLDNNGGNQCLEVHAATLEEQLTLLDEIIDALWEQSGLSPSIADLPVGQWR